MRQITIVNQSTVVRDSAVRVASAAIQQQLDQDVQVWWGRAAQLVMGGSGIPAGESIFILDDSDQADALGYHTLVQNSDVPRGFVFARTAILSKSPWTEVFSHETIEQVIDPWCNRVVVCLWNGRAVGVAEEPADPVEADSYQINGIAVSNFVTPDWYLSGGPMVQYDKMGLLTAPCTLRPGGYVSLTQDFASWQDVTQDVRLVRGYRAHPGVQKYKRKATRLLRTKGGFHGG